MIGLIFSFGTELVEVRIEGKKVYFRNSNLQQFATIEGIKLSEAGAIREFPDLKGNKEWRKIVIERFKEKIKAMKTEEEISKYIINDLKKYGYVPMYKKRKGFRPEKIK